MVGDEAGIHKPEQWRWNRKLIEEFKGTPWDWSLVTGEALPQSISLAPEMPEVADQPVDSSKPIRGPKSLYITRKDLEAHGSTGRANASPHGRANSQRGKTDDDAFGKGPRGGYCDHRPGGGSEAEPKACAREILKPRVRPSSETFFDDVSGKQLEPSRVLQARQDEVDFIRCMNVFDEVERPKDRPVLKGRWGGHQQRR